MLNTAETYPLPGQLPLPAVADDAPVECLKPREERFVLYFWETDDKQLAYRKAFNKPDATATHARSAACKLLKKSNIKKRLQEYRGSACARHKDQVLGYLEHAIRFDPRKMFDANGDVRHVHTLSADDVLSIGLEARLVDGSLRYIPVFADKKDSVVQMAKIAGMITTKGEIEHKGDALVSLLAALDGGSKQIVPTHGESETKAV